MSDIHSLINEAKLALHKLSIGEQIVTVKDPNLGDITFKPTTVGRLRNYISDLEKQAGVSVTNRRRPAGLRLQ